MTFLQNNIALIVAALLSGVAVVADAIRRSGKEVDTLVAVQLINYKEGLVSGCARRQANTAGHVPNSKHIPADKLEQRLQELEKFKSKPIVLIHRSGVQFSAKRALFCAAMDSRTCIILRAASTHGGRQICR